MAFRSAQGRIVHLRVNDLGHIWGSPDDALHTEVIVQLDTQPQAAFGFELRAGDDNLPARLAMLSILKDVYLQDLEVTLSYEIVEGKQNGHLRRLDLSRQR